MFSRLWLKNKKLDKFDSLDRNQQLRRFTKNEWNLLQSHYFENNQKHRIDYLIKVLLSQLMTGKKFSFKQDKNKTAIILHGTLRKLNLYTLSDIFNNSLFLTESWTVHFDKSFTLVNIKNLTELNELLINFKSNKTKSLLNLNIQSCPVRINTKNDYKNFYKKLSKESSSIG